MCWKVYEHTICRHDEDLEVMPVCHFFLVPCPITDDLQVHYYLNRECERCANGEFNSDDEEDDEDGSDGDADMSDIQSDGQPNDDSDENMVDVGGVQLDEIDAEILAMAGDQVVDSSDDDPMDDANNEPDARSDGSPIDNDNNEPAARSDGSSPMDLDEGGVPLPPASPVRSPVAAHHKLPAPTPSPVLPGYFRGADMGPEDPTNERPPTYAEACRDIDTNDVFSDDPDWQPNYMIADETYSPRRVAEFSTLLYQKSQEHFHSVSANAIQLIQMFSSMRDDDDDDPGWQRAVAILKEGFELGNKLRLRVFLATRLTRELDVLMPNGVEREDEDDPRYYNRLEEIHNVMNELHFRAISAVVPPYLVRAARQPSYLARKEVDWARELADVAAKFMLTLRAREGLYTRGGEDVPESLQRMLAEGDRMAEKLRDAWIAAVESLDE